MHFSVKVFIKHDMKDLISVDKLLKGRESDNVRRFKRDWKLDK